MRWPPLAEWIADHPWRVLGLCLALSAAALWPASRLRLETDLAALLPEDAPAARDYRAFLRTFGGFEKVFVVVRARGVGRDDPGPLVDAAAALAAELSKSREVASVRYGLTPEDERFFFRYVAPRAPLLLKGAAWEELRGRLEPAEIRRRVAMVKGALNGPIGGFAAPFFAADPLGLSEGLLAAAGSALPIDPLTGAFLSRRGDAVLLVVTPARPELDPAGGRALAADLEKAYSQVRHDFAGAHDSDRVLRLEFHAVGGPIYAAHDEAIIREDLVRITFSSVVSVALLVLAGFEGLFIPAVLFLVVCAGLLWAAALTRLWLGSVTVVGIGFIATLLGMGIDYGIHGGARFRLLLLSGESRRAALVGALRQTGPAILAATLMTAVALSALRLAHFRPLREMGEVLAIGILSILAATATVGAALLAVSPRGAALKGSTFLWRRLWTPALDGLVGFAARRPRWVLGGALVLSAAAACGLPALSLNADLRALRPADPQAAVAEKLLFEEFSLGADTSTLVLWDRDLASALDRAAEARRVVEGSLGGGADITSPADWMVTGRRLQERLRALRGLPLTAAADTLERELAAAGFRVERFAGALAALRAMGRGEDPGAPPAAEWPGWMAELIRPAAPPAGRVAVAVHVRAPEGRWPAGPPPAVVAALRRISPDLAIASTPRVGAELRDLAIQDMVRASALAALLVAVVVAIAFRRRWVEALLASLPLALGCLWTFGLWGLAGRAVDLVCIATLPVLVGTGVDLGVYGVYGSRRVPGGVAASVQRSGVALSLAALTTTAGFGSLESSRVPGLGNAGLIVAIGVVFCLLASLLVLPAIEALAGRSAAGAAPVLPREAA
ncbi:MAG TPA: MMPL family transporter [Thermoanaerobaculia bacterium]|nr:MMPL family transporter [Thermoanaerobaculia bacterium]